MYPSELRPIRQRAGTTVHFVGGGVGRRVITFKISLSPAPYTGTKTGEKMLRRSLLITLSLLFMDAAALRAYQQADGKAELQSALRFEGETVDFWHGFQRHRFQFDGMEAWVVEPKKARGDGAFSWCMMFPDAFTERCAAPMLLDHGFHHVYLAVGNTFGSPAAIKKLRAFHQELENRGLSSKSVLIGISRGGLYAHRYAVEYPDHVSVIYGDAPVLDFKSWPGGFGKGKGSPGDWQEVLKLYGFATDAEAKAYVGNPIDTLEVLAKKRIPLIYVAGDADEVVPIEENAAIVEERYRKLGGTVELIRKAGVGHHPHGLDDPAPVVAFIERHAK
jgi:pimeloyl-ACP methyl ester carboxylesterase